MLAGGGVVLLAVGFVLFLTQFAFGVPLGSTARHGNTRAFIPASFTLDPSSPATAVIEEQDCQGDGKVMALMRWLTAPDPKVSLELAVSEADTGRLAWERTNMDGGAALVGELNQETMYKYELRAPDQTIWAQGTFGTPTCPRYVEGCAPFEFFMSQGPRLGAVTDTTVRVWVRTCSPAAFAVEYKPANALWTEAQRASGSTMAEADNTGAVTLKDLRSGTAYDYRVVVNDVLRQRVPGSFRTLPAAGEPSLVTFVAGADAHQLRGMPLIFDTMAALLPDFALFIGDQIEVDEGRLGDNRFYATSKLDYELVYRRQWQNPLFRSFMTGVPTNFMWDDHDIANDWDSGKTGVWPFARAAYDEYAGEANPEPVRPGENYYAFSAGGADFFVLDTRSFRGTKAQPDGPDKTMLGEQQKADLKSWLLESKAPFKFIASSVAWNDLPQASMKQYDHWDGFLTERKELFDFIRDNHIGGVVLLSGDAHFSGVYKIPPWGLYEFSSTPLNVTPTVQLPFDPTDPQILFTLLGKRVFALFTVDTTKRPAEVHFRLMDAQGTQHYSLTLTEDELTTQSASGP